jgi:hypothetical protein
MCKLLGIKSLYVEAENQKIINGLTFVVGVEAQKMISISLEGSVG